MLGVLGVVGVAATLLVLFRVPQLLLIHGLKASALVWMYIALNAGRVNPILGATSIALAAAPLRVWTRRRTPKLPEAAGPRSGTSGQGPPLQVLILGDSAAAGGDDA